MFEQFAKQLGLGGERPEGADSGSAEGPAMSSFVDSIMNQLISKDVLYEPLTEIGAKYPAWLDAHRETLSAEEFGQYQAQHDFIQKILAQYDKDPEDYGALLDLLHQVRGIDGGVEGWRGARAMRRARLAQGVALMHDRLASDALWIHDENTLCIQYYL